MSASTAQAAPFPERPVAMPGFPSTCGHWTGSCIGNASYWVLINSMLYRQQFPHQRSRWEIQQLENWSDGH